MNEPQKRGRKGRNMKWLIEHAGRAIRHHRAAVTALGVVLVDVANGVPLLAAVGRALGGLLS